MYFAQRAINSFIKGKLMSIHLTNKINILDLMCGKGQDLARMINLGFKNIFMLDKDIDAIYELLDRKYNLRLKNKNNSANVSIYKFDMTDNFNTLPIKKDSINSIIINFGIHYLMDDINSIQNTINMINNFSKSKCRILITCFNGNKIFDLLRDMDSWDIFENNKLKYSIQKNYKSTTITELSQKINVLLPFSNNQYYEEYLVNIDYLIDLFNQNNIKCIKNDSFGTLLNTFKKENKTVYDQLTTNDKEYISLYHYLIFETK
jgi:SAM-dependent methyltransferase